MRRQILARQKTNPDRTGRFAEFRFAMSGPNTKLDDLLGPTPPPLDEAASIEDVCDERIPQPRPMFSSQILGNDPDRQSSITPYFQTVAVNSEANRTIGSAVISVANGVDECLPQRRNREQRLILRFEQSWLNPPGNRKMAPEKAHRFIKQLKSMPDDLPSSQELGLVLPAESSHVQLTLRELRRQAGPETHHRRIGKPVLPTETQPLEPVVDLRSGRLGLSVANRFVNDRSARLRLGRDRRSYNPLQFRTPIFFDDESVPEDREAFRRRAGYVSSSARDSPYS